jgi:PPOX class probable F420-dependent enzyme
MASGRGSVQMTEAEIEEFLTDNMKVQVATIGPDGMPHLTTLFYVVEDGRLAFWTYGASQKVVNLRRDPRISCLVEDGDDYFELRGVSIRGTARLIEEYDDIRALGTKVAKQMAGAGSGQQGDLGDFGDEIVEKQARKRVGIVVEPQKVASWDHAKMAGPPGSGGGTQPKNTSQETAQQTSQRTTEAS